MLRFCLLLTWAVAIYAISDQEAAQFSNSGAYCGTMEVIDNGDSFTFNTNGVPDHPWEDVNPHDVIAQTYSYDIPKTPRFVRRRSPGCVPAGPLGIAVNGVPIYNPLTSSAVNAVEGGTRERFDACDGHPDALGRYHYHKLPSSCVYGGNEDELVGVALDGYPIYGPLASDLGRDVTNDDLDECHGREVNGEYRYYMNMEFPYTIGCFKAKVGDNANQVSYTCSEAAVGVMCSCNNGYVEKSDVTTKRELRELINSLLNTKERRRRDTGEMEQVIDDSACTSKKRSFKRLLDLVKGLIKAEQ